MTQADAENIAGQGIESICSKFSGYKCFDRTQSMNAILKEQALGKDGLTNVDYEKIGKGVKGAEFVRQLSILQTFLPLAVTSYYTPKFLLLHCLD
jgi:hypothetical protein